MARQARTVSGTDYYHVMMRGNNKTCIFQRESDKSYLLELLFEFEREGLMQLAAWCVMDNHVHIALKADTENLTTALKRLNIRYAMYYHRVHGTIGHVFQDRFRSEPIETDGYLMMVTRYIHQNPVKAKMIAIVEEYQWSSYKYFLQSDRNEAMGFVYSLFNDDESAFRAYHTETDENNYLEIKEDREKLRDEKVQKVISRYCHEHGIQEMKEIHESEIHLKALVNELRTHGGMSLRGIGQLLEISYGTVRDCRSIFL